MPRLPEWLSDLIWVVVVLALMLGFALVSGLAMEWMMRASVWYGRGGPYIN
jgi:O-antigen ligase